jgi:DNA helicase II / ATP-dependent DNA helicase PcrA
MKALEEERRLAYVGLTRARQRVYISFAANRRVHNQWVSAIPSRFVDELPHDRVEVETETGLYGGVAASAERGRGAVPGYGYAGGGGARPARNLLIEGEARAVPSDGARRFEVGDRVFHQKFGTGNVLEVDGDKLRISFDRAGEKMVIASFLAPA